MELWSLMFYDFVLTGASNGLTQLHVSVACIYAVAEKRNRERAEAKHCTLATILTYLSLIYSSTRATYLLRS